LHSLYLSFTPTALPRPILSFCRRSRFSRPLCPSPPLTRLCRTFRKSQPCLARAARRREASAARRPTTRPVTRSTQADLPQTSPRPPQIAPDRPRVKMLRQSCCPRSTASPLPRTAYPVSGNGGRSQYLSCMLCVRHRDR